MRVGPDAVLLSLDLIPSFCVWKTKAHGGGRGAVGWGQGFPRYSRLPEPTHTLVPRTTAAGSPPPPAAPGSGETLGWTPPLRAP